MAVNWRLRSDKQVAATSWIRAYSLEEPEEEPVEVRLGHGRGWIAVADDAIWVIHALSRAITRLDSQTLKVTAILRLPKMPVGIAIAADAPWVVTRNGWLWRIDPSVPEAEGVARLGRRARALASDGSTLWALHDGGRLARIDPFAGEVAADGSISPAPGLMLASKDALWVASSRPPELLRIDPGGSSVLSRMKLPGRAVDLVRFGGDTWALCGVGRRGSSCSIIRAVTETGGAEEQLGIYGSRPQAAVATDDGILIASAPPRKPGDTSVQRFNPVSGDLRRAVPRPGHGIDRLAVSSRWVLAAMSIGVTHTIWGDAYAGVAFDAGAGGFGGGDGGGGGGG